VEGNSVQRAIAMHGSSMWRASSPRKRDQHGGKACGERELSMEGKLTIKEELATEGRWDRELSTMESLTLTGSSHLRTSFPPMGSSAPRRANRSDRG